jgi:predicted membrane protein
METHERFNDEYRHKMHHSHLQNNRAIVGSILVIVGIFLCLRNTGIFPDFISHVIFSWPMLLITIGLIITIGTSGSKTSGIILMIIGSFFLIPQIFKETFDVNVFWPSIFIIIGTVFIFSKRKGCHFSSTSQYSGEDYIDYVNIFSGAERQVVSDSFKGGKITAVFGGSEIDLTRTTLVPGVSELEVACVFGGTTLIVPDDWNIKIDIVPILGGFGDSRKLIPGRTVDTSKQLIIKGTVVFGGGEIKSY